MQATIMPTGPYIVGFTKFDLFDEYRPEQLYPNGRLIPIQIYFPKVEGFHAAYPKTFEPRAPNKFPPLECASYSKLSNLESMMQGKHSLIFLNHGNNVAMTDYAYLSEELASHGYVVISIQHQLNTDNPQPSFWSGRSCSKHSQIIDNILYVFTWVQAHQVDIFQNKIDINKTGLIGHSMGGNALLMLANRVSPIFRQNEGVLLPRMEPIGSPLECIIFMDGEFPPVQQNDLPIFYLLSEERRKYQMQSGASEWLKNENCRFKYYKGSRHISFTDHASILDEGSSQYEYGPYFKGTTIERLEFYKSVRTDILTFLEGIGI